MGEVIRLAVFGLFLASGAVALGEWAVRTRRINPFSRTGRLIRRTTDPVLAPIETWLLRRGGNPQAAGWWLFAGVAIGGVVVLSLGGWLAAQVSLTAGAASRGPRALVRLALNYAILLLMLALVVRVIASWFGKGRFTPWLRPTYRLTDWLVEPLRRWIPPIGMIDLAPLVAWLLLGVLRGVVLAVI